MIAVVAVEGKAEFKLLHQSHKEGAFVLGIAIGLFEDGAEVGEGEDAFFVDHQIMVVEDVVYAASDPFGVEDVGFAEAGVVAVVEDDAEIVEDFDEDFLVLRGGDFGLGAEGLVSFVGDEVVAGWDCKVVCVKGSEV